jgi:hypothetical protein
MTDSDVDELTHGPRMAAGALPAHKYLGKTSPNLSAVLASH